MFLALAWAHLSAAIYHLLTHAFFKALLFLAAGAVILALHHEHNLFKMGGLRKALPLTFWVFLIGAWALAGLPPRADLPARDRLLSETWTAPLSNRLALGGRTAGCLRHFNLYLPHGVPWRFGDPPNNRRPG